MPDRRKFLKSAAALSAAPFTVPPAFAGPGSRARFDAFIYDTRHGEARAFGARADQAGVPTHAFTGDITALWQQHLLGRWRTGPGALAGLSERPALFLLEQLGLEHGLRVLYQAEHTEISEIGVRHQLPVNGVRHQLLRGGSAELAAALEAAGRYWPVALADALLGADIARPRDVGPSGAAMAAHYGEPEKLYSWIIAPRSAA